MEEHLQWTWAIIKVDKNLYTFFQRINTTNNEYMKEFEAYIKVIDSYGGKTPIHPGIVKSKLTNMGVKDNNNKTSEEKEKLEG